MFIFLIALGKHGNIGWLDTVLESCRFMVMYLNVTPINQNQEHIVSTVWYNWSVFGHLEVFDETNTQFFLKTEWECLFACMWDNFQQFLLISNSLLGVVLCGGLLKCKMFRHYPLYRLRPMHKWTHHILTVIICIV